MMSTSVFLFFLYMHTPSSLFLLRHCQTFLFFFTPTRESLERGHLPFFFDRNRSSHPSHVIDAVSCDWMQHANIFETGKKTLLPFPAASTDQAEEKQTSGRIYKVDEKITESYRGETNDRNHRNLVAVQYLGIHTKVSVRGGILKIEPLVCRTMARVAELPSYWPGVFLRLVSSKNNCVCARRGRSVDRRRRHRSVDARTSGLVGSLRLNRCDAVGNRPGSSTSCCDANTFLSPKSTKNRSKETIKTAVIE